MHNKNVRGNLGSRTSYLWQSRLSRSVEVEFRIFGSPGTDEMWKWTSIFGSPGRTSVEDERDLSSPGRADVRKVELQIFGSQGSAEVLKRNLTSLKVPAKMKCGSGLTHTWKSWQNKCGRRTRSFEVLIERKYGKRNFRSLAVKAEQKCGAEFHIFGSPGRDEMWKWTYPYLEVLVEHVRKKNETFRSPGRAKVRKAELLIFGSKDRAELRKLQTFKSPDRAELMCRTWTSYRRQPRQDGSAEAELHILRRTGRAEVWNGFHVTSLVVGPNGSAGAEFQIFGSQVGSVETEFYIFDRSLSYWLPLPLPMLTNNSTDCYNCHSKWRTMWRPGVAKPQDFRSALDKVIMLPQGH